MLLTLLVAAHVIRGNPTDVNRVLAREDSALLFWLIASLFITWPIVAARLTIRGPGRGWHKFWLALGYAVLGLCLTPVGYLLIGLVFVALAGMAAMMIADEQSRR